jgi:hypothetical protein|uniref:Uncharacterized protein n=1 Tax=Myoviridae sp. ctshb19 TaxID=2825194 RepID=A0A8S5UGJ4_9CAUD|nr:MAG TPA: hypothetical protein [Myoviridae sp. ctshb19]
MTATKTLVKSVPAFDVVDLNQEIIDLPFGSMGDTIGKPGLRFCVEKQTRIDILHTEVSLSCVVYYAMENGDNVEESVERSKRFGHEMYWVNNCGAMITAARRARWELVLLKPGQKVRMNDLVMEFYRKGNSDHYGLREIA